MKTPLANFVIFNNRIMFTHQVNDVMVDTHRLGNVLSLVYLSTVYSKLIMKWF